MKRLINLTKTQTLELNHSRLVLLENPWRHLVEHRSRSERRITKEMQRLLAVMSLNKLQYFEHQFRLGAIDAIPFRAVFLVQVQTSQN